MRAPLLSIIVPVYNTAPYLPACLDSLAASTCFEECEVLAVDDGSTDNSREILREYAEIYPNLHFLDHGEAPWNRGVSATRNRGISAAAGEYLTFLDSDDAVEPDYLAQLLAAARERRCDILYGGYSRWDGVQPPHPILRPVLDGTALMTGREFLCRRLDANDRGNYACFALYRRAFLEEHSLSFDTDLRLYEDIVFSARSMAAAARVSTLPLYGYLYRVRPGSLVQSGVRPMDVDAMLAVLERLKPLLRESPEVGRFYFQLISMTLYYLGILTDEKSLSAAQLREYYRRLTALDLLPTLKSAAATRTERLKWLLWRLDWRLFYPLVRKK